MRNEKVGNIAGFCGWIATIELVLLVLLKLDVLDIGLLSLVVTVLAIGFSGVVVFGGPQETIISLSLYWSLEKPNTTKLYLLSSPIIKSNPNPQ